MQEAALAPSRGPSTPVRPRAWPRSARRSQGGRCTAAALLAAASAVAGAAVPAPQALGTAALAQAREVALAQARAQAPAGARIEVETGRADPRLRLAPCADIAAAALPGAPAWGRTRVSLACRDGVARWRVTLPMTVRVWAPAWVAGGPLAAGHEIGAGALRQAVVEWSAEASPPIPTSDDPAGRHLARPLAAGDALREADLRARQWFVPGDTVRVRAQGPGFVITADAQAMSAGVEGRPARLRSQSGRVFSALPVGERRAEIVW